jgi:hypothetical protein
MRATTDEKKSLRKRAPHPASAKLSINYQFSGQVPDLRQATGNKSLLVLFFRKEQDSSFLFRKRSKKTFVPGAVARCVPSDRPEEVLQIKEFSNEAGLAIEILRWPHCNSTLRNGGW